MKHETRIGCKPDTSWSAAGNDLSKQDPADEDAFHRYGANSLWMENLQLKSLVTRYHAELMEIKFANPSFHQDTGEPGVTVCELVEKLGSAADALDDADKAIRLLVSQAGQLAGALNRSQELLRRKEMLAREADHRIKNSLQMAASLLRIQADSQPDPANRAELRLAASRIGGIAQLHDLIQASSDSEMVNFGKYLHELCSCLSQSMGIDGQQRTLIVEVDSLHVPATTAQSLALIVNELVTNAFQHAFAPDQPGTVWVQSACRDDGALVVTVADDGKGLPECFWIDNCTSAHDARLGLRLVPKLAEQLGARLDVAPKSGTRFTLTLPDQKSSA
jgi:two-component system, sensor histidine kinase PdtaS